jgi:hypothetical protein
VRLQHEGGESRVLFALQGRFQLPSFVHCWQFSPSHEFDTSPESPRRVIIASPMFSNPTLKIMG